MTVPGTAKLNSVPNSSRRLPAKRCRISSQAVSMPTSDVRGVAIAAIVSVVKNDGHA